MGGAGLRRRLIGTAPEKDESSVLNDPESKDNKTQRVHLGAWEGGHKEWPKLEEWRGPLFTLGESWRSGPGTSPGGNAGGYLAVLECSSLP